MRKKCTFLLRLGILQMCLLWGFLGNIRTVKADLILDQAVIDGSHNIFFDAQPLREIQYNGTVVWRAGADITYVIDGGISKTHFVPYGETTLAVSADKAGYEFVGWRPDQTASGDVLTADLCTGDEKTLYAVFRKAVTVAYYNGSATKQTAAGYIYYNNGSLKNPDFTIPQTPLSGWTARGWARGQAADAGTEYTVLDHTVLTSDITLYGVYQKTITASFDGNGAGSGSVSALTATAYYNSAGNTLNPSFRMPANGFTKNGYTWSGWKQGSTGITRAAGENVTLSASTTFAAQWQTQIHNFAYTGNIQSWTVPVTGYYHLEAWGGSGGGAYADAVDSGVSENDTRGGNGGYAGGYKYLTAGTTLYICVGGAGEDFRYPLSYGSGGFNGGTDGHQDDHPDEISGQAHHCREGGGGGATHIAARSGLLENLEGHSSDILLAAGGGGGGLDNYEPEEMGGGDAIFGRLGGAGGSDINPDASTGFGRSRYASGAGGGYYAGQSREGGSSYIGGVLPSLTYGGHTYTSSAGTSSHRGNGAVTITYLGN